MKLMKYTTMLCLSGMLITTTNAQDAVPTLTVTNKPIQAVAPQSIVPTPAPTNETAAPTNNKSGNAALYSKPVRGDDISSQSVLNDTYFTPMDTKASQKIKEIEGEMYNLQSEIADAANALQLLEEVGQDLAASYYAAVATINTQLQSGTTPGNPRLKKRLGLAEDALDTLSGNVADLNKMAVRISELASVSNFLQQQARSAYSLSGSVEEDHVRLAKLEDALSNTATSIERLLNNVNDNITRAAAYMSSERSNLRTLALAITNGDLYGKSLSNRPFSMVSSQSYDEVIGGMRSTPDMVGASPMPPMAQAAPVLTSPRPLIKIRFDRPEIDYSQALYMSVNEAMQKYPNSQFDLVAVSPGVGNPAKLVIESTKARRNAEKVLRNMVQMGVDTNRVKLANLTKDDIQFNEVHLYIR